MLTSISSDVILTRILYKLDRRALAHLALTCKSLHQTVQAAREQRTAARRDGYGSWQTAWERRIVVCIEPYGAIALLQLLSGCPRLFDLRITASN